MKRTSPVSCAWGYHRALHIQGEKTPQRDSFPKRNKCHCEGGAGSLRGGELSRFMSESLVLFLLWSLESERWNILYKVWLLCLSFQSVMNVLEFDVIAKQFHTNPCFEKLTWLLKFGIHGNISLVTCWCWFMCLSISLNSFSFGYSFIRAREMDIILSINSKKWTNSFSLKQLFGCRTDSEPSSTADFCFSTVSVFRVIVTWRWLDRTGE